MKRAVKVVVVLAVMVVFLSVTGLPVAAQDKPADNMQILRDKVKADKKLVVAEAMGLTEAEGKVFWPLYEKYQKDLGKYYDRAFAMVAEYAKSYQSMTNPVAKKITDEFIALEAEKQKFMVSYLNQFRVILPDIRVARYYQIENKISAVVNFELAANIPLMK